MKLKMTKTLDPELIPNGSIGELVKNQNWDLPGLKMVYFGEFVTFVYKDEVEAVNQTERMDI